MSIVFMDPMKVRTMSAAADVVIKNESGSINKEVALQIILNGIVTSIWKNFFRTNNQNLYEMILDEVLTSININEWKDVDMSNVMEHVIIVMNNIVDEYNMMNQPVMTIN